MGRQAGGAGWVERVIAPMPAAAAAWSPVPASQPVPRPTRRARPAPPQLFCFRTAVMPEQVVAGAARFQDLAVADPALRSQVGAGPQGNGSWRERLLGLDVSSTASSAMASSLVHRNSPAAPAGRQALEEGVLRFGLWGIPNEDGTYTVGGRAGACAAAGCALGWSGLGRDWCLVRCQPGMGTPAPLRAILIYAPTHPLPALRPWPRHRSCWAAGSSWRCL